MTFMHYDKASKSTEMEHLCHILMRIFSLMSQSDVTPIYCSAVQSERRRLERLETVKQACGRSDLTALKSNYSLCTLYVLSTCAGLFLTEHFVSHRLFLLYI